MQGKVSSSSSMEGTEGTAKGDKKDQKDVEVDLIALLANQVASEGSNRKRPPPVKRRTPRKHREDMKMSKSVRAINELHLCTWFSLVRRTLGKPEDFAELENFNKTLAEEQGNQNNQDP